MTLRAVPTLSPDRVHVVCVFYTSTCSERTLPALRLAPGLLLTVQYTCTMCKSSRMFMFVSNICG